jgi:hypothetical protein
MKNENVVSEFLRSYDNNEKIKTDNLFFEDSVLYSYGYHYPLCIKVKSHNYNNSGYHYFINISGYSATTGKHTGVFCRALTGFNLKGLIEEKKKGNFENIHLIKSTEKLKEIIDFSKYKLNKSVKDLCINDLTLKELEN